MRKWIDHLQCTERIPRVSHVRSLRLLLLSSLTAAACSSGSPSPDPSPGAAPSATTPAPSSAALAPSPEPDTARIVDDLWTMIGGGFASAHLGPNYDAIV